MNCRTRLATTFAILITSLSSVGSRAGETPNIIYILADDLGYGDLSCYGQTGFQTPNIDRLATEGMKFTNHYSGNTVCSPSRAVLMTGQHSGHVYLRGNLKGEVGAELDPEITTLPEVLRSVGYQTGAFGKWGLGHTNQDGNASPLTHGFDEFFGWKSQTIAHTYYPSTVVHNGKEIPVEPGTYVHDMVLDKARDFIRRNANAERPFFCYVPTAVPHAAMHAPQKLHDKWRAKLPQFDARVGRYSAADEPCPDVVNPIAGFAAMMENLDNEVGSILNLLATLQIDEDTIVMFSSDNGAHKEGGHDPVYWNSTGGLRGHKRDMHEGGIRTPFLVRWPGRIQPNSESEHISGFQDVLPTICELTGTKLPPQNDGLSFLPTLTGKLQEKHEYLYWEFCTGTRQTIFSQAIRMSQWKGYLRKDRSMELFDLNNDPFEKTDVASRHPQVVEKLRAAMKDAHSPLKQK